MFSLMNPWVIVGILGLVLSSYFYGHHAAYVEQEAEIARLNLIERDKEQQMQAMADNHAKDLRKANQNAKTEVAKLQSDIADGRLRFSVRTISACQDTAVTGGNTESRAELDPEVSQALIAITADGDNAIRQLNACIDIYNEVRDKQ
jgi:type II secretory pathway pseudopilin PulG